MSKGLDSILDEFAASQNSPSTTVDTSDLLKTSNPFEALMNPNSADIVPSQNSDPKTGDAEITVKHESNELQQSKNEPESSCDGTIMQDSEMETTSGEKQTATKQKTPRKKKNPKRVPSNDIYNVTDKSGWTKPLQIRFTEQEVFQIKMASLSKHLQLQTLGRAAILDSINHTYACSACGLNITGRTSMNNDVIDLSGKPCPVCGSPLVLVEY